MISLAEIRIGDASVLRCAKCGTRAAATPSPLAAVQADVASASQRAEGGVVFTGFEPFAHPELPQLIAAAADAGFARIRLRTDAGALALSGNADGALRAGVSQFEVVLLGGGALHDRLSARAGRFDAAFAGVAAVRAAAAVLGADIFISTLVPVCSHNASALAEAVQASALLGAESVLFDCREHAPDPAVLAAALDAATVNRIAAAALGVPVAAPYDRAPVVVVAP